MVRSDCIGGGLFIGLGVFIWILTLRFPGLEGGHPGPALFPQILASLFIFFGGLVLLRGARAQKNPSAGENPTGTARNYFDPIFVLMLIVAYILFSNRLGFLITSSLILFLLMVKLKVPLWRSGLIAILLSLFVNALFAKLLRVPLPIGLWSW